MQLPLLIWIRKPEEGKKFKAPELDTLMLAHLGSQKSVNWKPLLRKVMLLLEPKYGFCQIHKLI